MPQLDALLALVPLDRLPRTGWLQAGIPEPESVAAHSLGVALVALALGPEVDPPLDVDRAVALCVVHDAPEAQLGDIPRSCSELLPEGAKRGAEEAAADALLTPLGALARARFGEFVSGETREARFAKLCDGLHLGVRLLAYHIAGARGLGEFRETLARLNAGEFAPCERLRRQLLERLDAPRLPI